MIKISEKLTKEELKLLDEAGYSRKIIELYGNNVNVGIIENPDVALAYTGPCGDTIKLYLKIAGDNVIEDARFQYLGCPPLAACGSVLTQIVRDKTLKEAKEVITKEVLTELGGLPDDECHCAELAVTTLHKTIMKYKENKKMQ
jgi:nitrogen fixation NifU-like protein